MVAIGPRWEGPRCCSTSLRSASRIADRVYVLELGRVGREGNSAEPAADDYIRQAYLGVA